MQVLPPAQKRSSLGLLLLLAGLLMLCVLVGGAAAVLGGPTLLEALQSATTQPATEAAATATTDGGNATEVQPTEPATEPLPGYQEVRPVVVDQEELEGRWGRVPPPLAGMPRLPGLPQVPLPVLGFADEAASRVGQVDPEEISYAQVLHEPGAPRLELPGAHHGVPDLEDGQALPRLPGLRPRPEQLELDG